MVSLWASLPPDRFFRIVIISASCFFILLVPYFTFFHLRGHFVPTSDLSPSNASSTTSALSESSEPLASVVPRPASTLRNGTRTITTSPKHPIDFLVRLADKQFDDLLADEVHNISEAARVYRAKRGRHPPPGFDKWFEYANKTGALIVESFFDQIYTDLEPFWGADAEVIRDFSKRWPDVLSVRKHLPVIRTRDDNVWFNAWRDMLLLMPPLPDVDIPLLHGDEPRILLTYDRVGKYMQRAGKARKEHNSLPIRKIRDKFPTHPQIKGNSTGERPLEGQTMIAPREYWDFVLSACRPGDPVFARSGLHLNSTIPPVFSTKYTAGTLKGYVSNYTIARSVCYNPNLRSLHGFMIAPHLEDVYTDLYPIFGPAKVQGVGNDILIPNPDHWNAFSYYGDAATITPWSEKKNASVWRGSASGGQHHGGNWWGFQRHRLIAMMNKTTVSTVEREMKNLSDPTYENLRAAHPDKFDLGIHNFAFPNPRLFNITALAYNKLGKWTARIADGGFTHMFCHPLRLFLPANACSYTAPYYNVTNLMTQEEILAYKFLPDVDGQASSGRFRSFLQSLSVPIKASIFVEWRDTRLVPWRHFVPMTNEYQDWWGIMEYFLGYKGTRNERTAEGHDEIAERIGKFGSEWVNAVTRREDMLIYFHRLILEFARICADERVELGYTADLKRK